MLDRPQGARLRVNARVGTFETMLVYRIDRLARSARLLLDTHDTPKLASVTGRSMTEPFDTSSPLSEFIMALSGSLAALRADLPVAGDDPGDRPLQSCRAQLIRARSPASR